MQQPIQLRLREHDVGTALITTKVATAPKTAIINTQAFKRRYLNYSANNNGNCKKVNISNNDNNNNDDNITNMPSSVDIAYETRNCCIDNASKKIAKIVKMSASANNIKELGAKSAVTSPTSPLAPASHECGARKLLSHPDGALPPPLKSTVLSATTLQQFAAQRNAAVTSTGVYGHFQSSASNAIGTTTTAATGFMTTASNNLDQYRLQLYNYALSIESLRCPSYTAAAAMAAAAYTNNGALPNVQQNNFATNCGTNSAIYPGATNLSYTPTGSRLALSMSLFPQRIFQPEEPKPQYSYIGLIAMAILNSAETKLVLSDIYQYILDNYPYFRTRGPGWRNSIRHNLSLNDCFIKSGRSANGKGHYWAIHPANMDDFRKGDFRRRKAQRKVRKHMGLSVDDMGTDSPSPPPLEINSPPSHHHVAQHIMAHAAQQQRQAAEQLAVAAAAQTHAFGYIQQQQHHQITAHLPMQHMHATALSQQFQQQQQQHQTPHHNYMGQAIYGGSAALAVASAATATHYTAEHQPLQQQSQCTYHDELKADVRQELPLLANEMRQDTLKADALERAPTEAVNARMPGNRVTFFNDTNTTTTTSATANVFANLYSQTQKRQFDVASLLAPDIKVDIVDDMRELRRSEDEDAAVRGMTATQHTVLTKVSLQHQRLSLPPLHFQQQFQQESKKQLPKHHIVNAPESPVQVHEQQFCLFKQQEQCEGEDLEQEQDEIDVVANDCDGESHNAVPSNSDDDATYNDDVEEPLMSAGIMPHIQTTVTYVGADAESDGSGDGDEEAEPEVGAEAEADIDTDAVSCSIVSSEIVPNVNKSRYCLLDEHKETPDSSPIRLQVLRQPDLAAAAAAAAAIVNNAASTSPVVYELHSSSFGSSSQPDSLEETSPSTIKPASFSVQQLEIVQKQQCSLIQHIKEQQQEQQQQHQPYQPQQTRDNGTISDLQEINSHFFGQYYGTYMAAAAARSMGNINVALQRQQQLQSAVEQRSENATEQHQQRKSPNL